MPNATLRPPDFLESNPKPSIDRYVRLKLFVEQECNDQVCLIDWIPSPGATTPNQGVWGAWLDRPSPFIHPFVESGVVIAPRA